ncbi:L-ribulose-5-phosphate 3-epimerase [Streptobacillus notomytis]|uniref:L-ribulose-5-phosphate 3-epimerase n=1 Tax=Streptobacillus notomytis TaxID=1712031 RepID=UPI001FD00F70|nr:L-ribulose-5-phosphate 3-epimerase [Streptobacillus notomytis]
MKNLQLGIYEKALPKKYSFKEKIKLAKELGFTFIEISVDESDERLARLDWDINTINELKCELNINNIRIPTMTFSGHRRYPMGSHFEDIRKKSMELMEKAILLADRLGIRIVQLAGYDVYYEQSDEITEKYFIENLSKALKMAEEYNVCLAIEIMDHPFINSITKYMKYSKLVNSPYLKVYPDLGNLSAWQENDVSKELELGMANKEIVAIHVKDTLAVTENFPGKFKEVDFGAGCVDFVKCFEKLFSLNYSGPFLIEMWTENYSDIEQGNEEVRKAREFVLEAMRNGGYLC